MANTYKRMLLACVLTISSALGAFGLLFGPHNPAHHRNPPQVPNHDAAGKTCPPKDDCTPAKKLRIVSIIPKNYPSASELADFGHAIVGSNWMAQFTAAYDIPGPASAKVIENVTDMPDLNHGTKNVSDYRDYV